MYKMGEAQLKLCLNGEKPVITNGYSFSTRYRGSKKKIVNWLWDQIKDLDFDTFLDAMGGTGCVAYKAKQEGKQVTYNDVLKYNHFIGLALIENRNVTISEDDVNFILKKHENLSYSSFIKDTFKDIYFTDEENEWLDMVIENINHLENPYKKALALHCLFQSCISKRPYNLFHRKNLYVRTSDVKRSFGNKATWDKPFPTHFKEMVKEANKCVFSNGHKGKSINYDVFEISGEYDLVYIDTPYIPVKGEIIDYRDAYHFLEGLVNYKKWASMIDHSRKHLPLKKEYCVWNDKKEIKNAFEKLIRKFKDSKIVISYRKDGIPSEKEIYNILKKYKANVKEVKAKDFKYVLSKQDTQELLFIGF